MTRKALWKIALLTATLAVSLSCNTFAAEEQAADEYTYEGKELYDTGFDCIWIKPTFGDLVAFQSNPDFDLEATDRFQLISS